MPDESRHPIDLAMVRREVPAEYLWPRPAHPLRRRLSPRRVRQRWRTRHAVRFAHSGPPISGGLATDMRSITFWHRDRTYDSVGKVSFLICHNCRHGFIGNIDVLQILWGQGIATRALAHIRARVPGYTWRTSRQRFEAKSFWLLIAERTGEDYTDDETDWVCPHMEPYWRGGVTFTSDEPDPPLWLLRMRRWRRDNRPGPHRGE